ncbi:MAG TPA: hypothetical protein VMU94_26330 [Streptosporangiaceae bacterium]|nr:hypothetical protein [Streptosporangiaceae bacterium]
MPGDRSGNPEALIVRAEEWPWGLRCGQCSRPLEDGDPYAERLTGMVSEFPAYMIVCCPCGGQHTIMPSG